MRRGFRKNIFVISRVYDTMNASCAGEEHPDLRGQYYYLKVEKKYGK